MHTQGGDKNLGPNLQKKVVIAPPESPIFKKILEIWMVGVVHLVYLAYVLRAATKKDKRSSTFLKNKSAPPSWLRL